MPNEYYATPFFRLCIFAYFILLGLSFTVWYYTVAEPAGPNAWIPLLSYLLLSFLLAFFPSGSLHLPSMLVPLVQLLTLLVFQLVLDMLPHRLNGPSLVPPILVLVLMCTVLIQRSHTIAAWLLFGVSVLLIVKWHLALAIPQYAIAAEFLVPAGVVFSNHLFKAHIDQATHKARQSRVLLQNAELGQAQERGISSVAARRVSEVRSLTEDMLHRIAYDPAPVTAEEIDDFRFTEAQLRDTIRGRHIVNEEILRAALAARRRGAKVDILDERGEMLPEQVVTSLTKCAVDLLNKATAGTITIRAFPKTDQTAVMLVHDGNSEEEEPSAIEIDQKTGEVIRL